MATVNHSASLIIGKKARFIPIEGQEIPKFCFGFARYEMLQNRIKNNKVLTDYIGRVDKNYLQPTTTNKILRKVAMTDEWKNKVEITLWPEMMHLIGDEVVVGDIVAIMCAQISKHNGRFQLESTHLATVVVNPECPHIADKIARLKALPPLDEADNNDPLITLQELKSPTSRKHEGVTRFRCRSWMESIDINRRWYYVYCSTCDEKVYPEEDGELHFVCKDCEDVTPIFKYSVNAIINDSTKPIEVVFFNEGMEALLKITCKDLITKHGCTDPKKLPQQMALMIGKSKIMHLSLRKENNVVVTNVSESETTVQVDSPAQHVASSALPPATPNLKANKFKRPHAESGESTQCAKKTHED
ncbi:replication protein A 70 kDa DNA-binding subunit-like [Helianthus annuus]|uniref:replication protein A 70 kDa DNA-binding subunit-like n=1 Tax=Helianthus annuus TaxID=4232 RepID=UPI000B8FB811|nr:replication protein A 70 kDa DNA-binding subunit-like [Helianthus annuus]